MNSSLDEVMELMLGKIGWESCIDSNNIEN